MARTGRPKKEFVDKKTATLTLRLDPRVRFAMEFTARVTGQSITKVVETALVRYADGVKSGDKNWREFWNVSDGVRELAFLFEGKSFRTYEEDLLRDFVDRHDPFFTVDLTQDTLESLSLPFSKRLDPDKVDVLWPDIQKYLNLWEETKATDHWAVAKAMGSALKKAGLYAPDWPVKNPDLEDKQGDVEIDQPNGPADETSS